MVTDDKMVEFSCVVCGGRKRAYPQRHFGADSVCGACAVFFARNAHKKPACRNGRNKCKLQNRSASLTGKNLCRSCRLNRCFKIGMHNNEKGHQHQKNPKEAEKYEKRTKKEENAEKGQGPSKSANVEDDQAGLMLMRMLMNEDPMDAFTMFPQNSLLATAADENNKVASPPPLLCFVNPKLAQVFHTLQTLECTDTLIWTQFAKLRGRQFRVDNVDKQFPTLMDMIRCNENWYCDMDKYTEPSDPKQELHTYLRHCMTTLLILNITFMRKMPHFQLLSANDQCLIVGALTFTIYELNNRVLSETYTKEGVITTQEGDSTNIFKLLSDQFNVDKTVNFAHLLYNQTYEPFKGAQLSAEEFLLLRAIVATHPVINGLSSFAQKLQQRESERYASALMQLERHLHGEVAGVRRYAEILHLAVNMFHVDKKYREFNAYIMMVANQEFHKIVPKVVQKLCLEGGGAVY